MLTQSPLKVSSDLSILLLGLYSIQSVLLILISYCLHLKTKDWRIAQDLIVTLIYSVAH